MLLNAQLMLKNYRVLADTSTRFTLSTVSRSNTLDREQVTTVRGEQLQQLVENLSKTLHLMENLNTRGLANLQRV